jgi:hypothetical protein
VITEADLQGHWHRDWIRAPGFEDTTTRVHWLQAGALYADIRVPAERPDLFGADCLADLGPADMRALLRAEGFAGTIDVTRGICTWTREINWHGRPLAVDAGRMSRDGVVLYEDGVHADYRELWLPRPGSFAARRVAADGLSGILVASDELFLLGLGDPYAPPSGPILEALEAGQRPEDLPARFRAEYTYGRWEGDDGIALLSTNPFREGLPALRRAGEGLTWLTEGFDGRERAVPLDGPSRVAA